MVNLRKLGQKVLHAICLHFRVKKLDFPWKTDYFASVFTSSLDSSRLPKALFSKQEMTYLSPITTPIPCVLNLFLILYHSLFNRLLSNSISCLKKSYFPYTFTTGQYQYLWINWVPIPVTWPKPTQWPIYPRYRTGRRITLPSYLTWFLTHLE